MIREFDKTLRLMYDDDMDLHFVVSDGKKTFSIEQANYFGGGGNKKIYLAARALKEAIDEVG